MSRADLTTRLRLASGLVLMAFAASHLANHALGIVSLAAMEQARTAFVAVWRSPPGTLLLYRRLLGHVALALHKLYRRRSLRMPAWEVGPDRARPADPVLAHGRTSSAPAALHQLRSASTTTTPTCSTLLWPDGAGRQSLMLTLVWLHGCIGVHFWLRLRALVSGRAALLLALRRAAADAGADRLRRRRARGAGAGRGRSGVARGAGRDRRLAGAGRARLGLRAERRVLTGFVLLLLATFGGRGGARAGAALRAAGSACATRAASRSRSRPA